MRVADDSADAVSCGTGRDTVYVEDTAPERDDLTGCEEVVRVPPEPATDATPPSVIRGGPGNDTLFGTAGADSLFGQDGNDGCSATRRRLRRR